MVEIFTNSKIYISCPAYKASGGPELLHQLAYNLIKELKVETYMFYYPSHVNNPVHPAYKFYNIPYMRSLDDKYENILIVPEVKSGCELLKKFKNIRKGIWFLSVDGYYLSRIRKFDFFIQRLTNKLYKICFKKNLFDIQDNINLLMEKLKNKPIEKADFYLSQTYRGMDFLNKKGVNPIYYLSDYLNEDFLKTTTDLSQKEDIVAFNPRKGILFTEKIIEKAKKIKFIPIINMTRNEVIQTLQKAKVYIDFGNHPGKDRLPREAAILMCCVITGKRGSAAFYEDVPIPEEYKFDDKEENIPEIVEKIRDCLKNFDSHCSKFDQYREIIKQEPQKFLNDLKKIFLIQECYK